ATEVLDVFEGFNSTVMPACWSQQQVIGTDNLQFVPNSTNPVTTPEEGSDFIWYNSFNITAGHQTRLVSPAITTIGASAIDVRFQWFNENSTLYNTGLYATAEGVQVQYSTDAVTWINAGPFITRYDSTLATGTGQWNAKNIS